MPPDATMQEYVTSFEEASVGNPDLYGGKGASLVDLQRHGMPVPPGFILTTKAFHSFRRGNRSLSNQVWASVELELQELERKTGRRFGSGPDPLFLSVRSGAPVSMPGMMDTVLNVGFTNSTASILARAGSPENFIGDAFSRFLRSFGEVVLDVDWFDVEEVAEDLLEGSSKDAPLEQARALAAALQQVSGVALDNPIDQLRRAVSAVFDSWDSPRAAEYRRHYDIAEDLGTAAVVQCMVFGNRDHASGTGVLFSRDPLTGVNSITGDYLASAQGEDVVSGVRNVMPISLVQDRAPELFEELRRVATTLEQEKKQVQEIEFTIEQGRLFVLQSRTAKLAPQAEVQTAVDLVDAGTLSYSEAVRRLSAKNLRGLIAMKIPSGSAQSARAAGRLIARATSACTGTVTGRVAFTPEQIDELAPEGGQVVFVRPETSPKDVAGMIRADAIVTARGGATSHAAVVARSLGKPCVVGAEGISVSPEQGLLRAGDVEIHTGDWITVDGWTGEIYAGRVDSVLDRGMLEESAPLQRLLGWARQMSGLEVVGAAHTRAEIDDLRLVGAAAIFLRASAAGIPHGTGSGAPTTRIDDLGFVELRADDLANAGGLIHDQSLGGGLEHWHPGEWVVSGIGSLSPEDLPRLAKILHSTDWPRDWGLLVAGPEDLNALDRLNVSPSSVFVETDASVADVLGAATEVVGDLSQSILETTRSVFDLVNSDVVRGVIASTPLSSELVQGLADQGVRKFVVPLALIPTAAVLVAQTSFVGETD